MILLAIVYRYIDRVVKREEILVTPKHLTIIVKGLFNKNVALYDVASISHFKYLSQDKPVPHPLEGQSLDYTGFGALNKEVTALADDGTLQFFYEGRNIKFGKNIPSSDAEEIAKIIYKLTQNDLRFDDKYEEEILGIDPDKSKESSQYY
jgi:hypothetical protein